MFLHSKIAQCELGGSYAPFNPLLLMTEENPWSLVTHSDH